MKPAESVLDIFQLNHLRSGSDPGSRGRTMSGAPAAWTTVTTFWATASVHCGFSAWAAGPVLNVTSSWQFREHSSVAKD